MQPDIFATDPNAPEVLQLAMVDADVRYYPHWLDGAQADHYLRLCEAQLPWSQDYIKVYGREVKIPRLQAWIGDPEAQYTYSQLQMQPHPWCAPLDEIKTLCEQTCQTTFNSVLANWYRDGQDSMGMHSDDEPELGHQPVIASVTLGTTRRFIFKHKRTGEKEIVELQHGSLLVMQGMTQQCWQHGINKSNTVHGGRINLTYRYVHPQ